MPAHAISHHKQAHLVHGITGLSHPLSSKQTILIGLMFSLLAHIRPRDDAKPHVLALPLSHCRARFLRVRQAILWYTWGHLYARRHLPGRLILYSVAKACWGRR